MPIREYGPIATLARYPEVAREIRQEWPQSTGAERKGDEEKLWFRGQKVANWGLAPKLYREPFAGADEDEIRLEFQSQGLQLIGGRLPTNKWEWYFLMQHHRAPTRLLDWTENRLIGLFFAVEEEIDEGTVRSVGARPVVA